MRNSPSLPGDGLSPEVRARIHQAANAAFDKNPGDPIPAEVLEKIRRLLPPRASNPAAEHAA